MCTGLEIAAGISAVTTIFGAAQSYQGTQKTVAAEQDASAASRRAEEARAQQSALEFARKNREIIRQSLIARANASSSAANQGANYGSGIQGAFAAFGGQEAAAVNTNQRAFDIGQDIFAANADYASAQGRAAEGRGMSSLGGALMASSTQIGKIGSLFVPSSPSSNPYNGWTTDVFKG